MAADSAAAGGAAQARGDAAGARRKPRQRRPTGNALTVREVARAAGVSVATVSRALNSNPHVDPELRDRVLRAASGLGYTPHAAARALASQRFTSIGAIVPTLEDSNFATGIAALQRRLVPAGYTLLLAASNHDAGEELAQARALVANGIAGLVLFGARHARETYALLRARAIPWVNTWVVDDAHPCVGFDDHAIGRALANHLADLGHVRVGVIAQHLPESDRAAGRVAGIREALAARGLPPPAEHLIERSHKIADGREGLRALASGPDRPTAVVCGTDVLAFGALVEARALGLDVPRDLSVAGIDDAEFAAHLAPPLTTVRLSAADVCERAADFLVAHIRGERAPRRTRLEFELVVRASTARPPDTGTRPRCSPTRS